MQRRDFLKITGAGITSLFFSEESEALEQGYKQSENQHPKKPKMDRRNLTNPKQKGKTIEQIIKGIDVSHYQLPPIDWKEVYKQGIRFVYIKSSQGVDYKDEMFDEYLEGAKKAKLYTGCYHYGTPGYMLDKEKAILPQLKADARAEADYFLTVANKGLKKGNMRPALDLEHCEGINDLTDSQLAYWVINWMDRVKSKIGKNPLLYGKKYPRKAALGNRKIIKNYDLWGIDYDNRIPVTAPWDKFLIWQYDFRGIVAGVGNKKGYVDLDVFYGNKRDFKKKILL